MDEGEKRREFFLGWKEKKGSGATYGCLIRALLKIKSRQDAESICKLLQASTSAQRSCCGRADTVEPHKATLNLQEDKAPHKRQHESMCRVSLYRFEGSGVTRVSSCVSTRPHAGGYTSCTLH